MRFKTSMMWVVIALWTIAASVLATPAGKPKPRPKADAISGEWRATLTTQDNTLQLKLNLKLNGNQVTGTSESSHLGNGTITNGSWTKNLLKMKIETGHATLVLAGALQKGKLAGEWDAGHLKGKWEAVRK